MKRIQSPELEWRLAGGGWIGVHDDDYELYGNIIEKINVEKNVIEFLKS